MHKDVKIFCETCTTCIRAKHKNLSSGVELKHKSHLAPSELLAVDIVGKINPSNSGNHYILSIIDHFSRFATFIPLKNISSSTIIKELDRYFATHGICTALITDQGSNFTSHEFETYLKAMGIKHNKCSLQYPAANGLIERIHSILKSTIISLSNKYFDWDKKLLLFNLYINTSKCAATNYSPSELYFGRIIRTPFNRCHQAQLVPDEDEYMADLIKTINETRQKVQEFEEIYLKSREKYLPKRRLKQFNIGDKVFLKALDKAHVLSQRFLGPYVITKIFRNHNYWIEGLEDKDLRSLKIHGSKLYKLPHQKPQLHTQNLNPNDKNNENPTQQDDTSTQNSNIQQTQNSQENIVPNHQLFDQDVNAQLINQPQLTGVFNQNNKINANELPNNNNTDQLNLNQNTELNQNTDVNNQTQNQTTNKIKKKSRRNVNNQRKDNTGHKYFLRDRVFRRSYKV